MFKFKGPIKMIWFQVEIKDWEKRCSFCYRSAYFL